MTSEMMPCHECNGTGLIGMKVGARHQCNLCEGEGKFKDRRAARPPATAPDLARLAEEWAKERGNVVSRMNGPRDAFEAALAADARAETAFLTALSALLAEVREVTGPFAKAGRIAKNWDDRLTIYECWTDDGEKASITLDDICRAAALHEKLTEGGE